MFYSTHHLSHVPKKRELPEYSPWLYADYAAFIGDFISNRHLIWHSFILNVFEA